SVRPQAPSHSHVANFGSQRCFCSSLPNVRICPVHNELCAASDKPIEPQTLAISVITVTYSKYPNPDPPYSSGTKTPIIPSSPNCLNSSTGKVCVSSHSITLG